MNALARYFLVFLLGWSGAVWSYSDLIYKANSDPEKIKILKKSNDISLPDALKPSSEETSGLNAQSIELSSPATTPKQEETTEESSINQ
jgi:hypothetical protein